MHDQGISGVAEKPTSINLWKECGHFALLTMDAAWLSLAYCVIASPAVSFWVVLGFFGAGIFISHIISRLLNHYDINLVIRRISFSVWIIIFLILSRKVLIGGYGWIYLDSWIDLLGKDSIGSLNFTQFLRVFIPLIVVARGHYFARNRLDFIFYQDNFKLSLVLIGTGGLFYQGPQHQVIVAFFLFMGVGLIGSYFTRIFDLSSQPGGKIPRLGIAPLKGISFFTLIILGSGITLGLLAGILWGDFFQTALKTIIAAVFIIIGILASPIILVLFYIFEKLVSLLPDKVEMPSLEDNGGQLINELKNLAGSTISKDAANLLDIGSVMILGSILILTILSIYISMRWRKSQSRVQVENSTSFLNEKADTKHTHKVSWLENLVGLRSIRRRYYANRIRAIYSNLLELAAELGSPRNPALTPFEYLPVISACFPMLGNEIKLITNGYVQVRYGEIPETEEEFGMINEAWKLVNEYGKTHKNINKNKK